MKRLINEIKQTVGWTLLLWNILKTQFTNPDKVCFNRTPQRCNSKNGGCKCVLDEYHENKLHICSCENTWPVLKTAHNKDTK